VVYPGSASPECDGEWCCAGDIVEFGRDEARRISFSVVARWRANFRRWLSDASDVADDSSAVSLASRSFTWRSFRSRNAL
jgi:hypothetical protein